MPLIAYDAVELPTRGGVVVARHGQRELMVYESIWNGRDLSSPEPHRRHAEPTDVAALPADPEQMVRAALALRAMSVSEMAAHFGVSRAVFSRVLARLRAERVITWRYERRRDGYPKVYRLSRRQA